MSENIVYRFFVTLDKIEETSQEGFCMEEHEIIERIKSLCEARGWTVYRLSKESGITYSTLCTILHKVNVPSFSTLNRICSGFGITLSQFFDINNDYALMDGETKEHIQLWNKLSKENRVTVQKYVQYLISQQNSSE